VDLMLEDALREAAATEDRVVATLERLAEVSSTRHLILASHDDDSAERVELMYGLGCRMAEFPLTVDAARRARELGMRVSMGAANAYRGGSLSGNAGTLDLLQLGFVDILIADYYAPAMLAALYRIVALGLGDLPTIARLLTKNPAEAVGLDDRGEIVPGRRADLLVVDDSGPYPTLFGTMVRGDWAYAGGWLPTPTTLDA
jgi:alpha-D-ribose 1-methylphosphonate 5-triphosphate diphosphatase